MNPDAKMTPKDFFLYAGAMVTLYWSAGSLIALLFAIFDAVWRDPLNYYYDPYSGGIRFAIASLLVIFPLSLFLFTYIKKETIAEPAKLLLPLRRWLYSLTIFITGLTLTIDVILLINNFLGGELTVKFVSKAVSVIVVAGLVLWYCLLEIRMRPGAAAKIRKEFLCGAPILVVAAIVYGFFVMGSPATIRKIRLDEQRVSELSSIQNQIVYSYWTQKGVLPKSLQNLNDRISGFRMPVDPVTAKEYEYKVTGALVFELCADFDAASQNLNNLPAVPKSVPREGPYGPDNWVHGPGHICFERTIDPELYPVRPGKI